MNMHSRFRKSHIVFLLAAFFACAPVLAFAESAFHLTPLIIDEKAHARDIIKKTVGLSNASDHTVQLYGFVNNVDPTLGVEDFSQATGDELSDSLANWIEITRGVQVLAPNEKIEIPMLIQVNLKAVPGIYHAFVSFADGSSRAEAEKNIKNGVTLAINLEVLDDSKEVLQLNSFVSKDTFVTGGSAKFALNIQNIGNRALTPKGDVRIFNKRGEEIATIPVNQKGEAIDPAAVSQLASAWNAGSSFGRYKAMLNIEYGDKEPRGTLQDTVFFWLIPWKALLSLFLSMLAIVVGLAVYFHNRYLFNQNQRLVHAVSRVFSPDDSDVHSVPFAHESKIHAIERPVGKNRGMPLFAKTPAIHHKPLNSASGLHSISRSQPKPSLGGWTDVPRSQATNKAVITHSAGAVRLEPRQKARAEERYIVDLKK